jgi:hypothetical protein
MRVRTTGHRRMHTAARTVCGETAIQLAGRDSGRVNIYYWSAIGAQSRKVTCHACVASIQPLFPGKKFICGCCDGKEALHGNGKSRTSFSIGRETSARLGEGYRVIASWLTSGLHHFHLEQNAYTGAMLLNSPSSSRLCRSFPRSAALSASRSTRRCDLAASSVAEPSSFAPTAGVSLFKSRRSVIIHLPVR